MFAHSARDELINIVHSPVNLFYQVNAAFLEEQAKKRKTKLTDVPVSLYYKGAVYMHEGGRS